MNTKIEFHILQSFPPSNLNRDESNMPKDTFFGGVRRARISSQSFKRAIRLDPHFGEATSLTPSSRTRRLKKMLTDKMNSIHAGENNEALAEAFTTSLLGSMDKKNPERSSVLFFISDEEVEKISKMLLEAEKVEDVVGAYKNEFSKRTPAADIALFGRMLAEDPKLNVDAACQVAHAISTHKVDMELDFFTAAESLSNEEDPETGAGMMGVTGYNASCFYRYAAIDWNQLINNLGGDRELALKAVSGFMYSLAFALPSGKQNAFAANTTPYFLMAVIREDGQTWSLANAFEQPVFSKNGYQLPSLEKLIKHWDRLEKVFTLPEYEVKAFSLSLDSESPSETLPGTTVNSFNEWVKFAAESLKE